MLILGSNGAFEQKEWSQRQLIRPSLIFSGISPRLEAISRLERAGWRFLIGQPALDFAAEILGLDVAHIWDRPAIKAEIKKEVDGMMDDIRSSYSFSQFLKKE